jgi:CheY-like chemotaxis protein
MTLPSDRPRKILLIEDDAWIRRPIQDALLDEGYEVVEAADGRTGLRLAKEYEPDLVLLDLAMPEFTGIDVLHNLKQAPGTRALPVLIMSAYKSVMPEQDMGSVVGVLSKPLDVDALLVAIRDSLGTAEREL